jgi:hypothetical protein
MLALCVRACALSKTVAQQVVVADGYSSVDEARTSASQSPITTPIIDEGVRRNWVMRRFHFWLIAVVAATLVPSLAAGDPLSGLYSNPVTIMDTGTGTMGTLIVNQNQTYLSLSSLNGQPVQVSGAWALQSDGLTVCLSPQSDGAIIMPATAGCLPLGGHVAGDSWTGANDANQQLSFSVAAGQ